MPIETIVKSSPETQQGGGTKKMRSFFPNLGKPILQTFRFGEYAPVKAYHVLAGDRNFKNAMPHDIRSGLLKAPLMQKMFVRKDWFYVAKQAYLPENWEKLSTTPTQGDLCPEDANTVVNNFETTISQIMSSWKSKINEWTIEDLSYNVTINEIIRYILFGEMFYSTGSLMTYLGRPMNLFFEITADKSKNRHNWGKYFDTICNKILESIDGAMYLIDGDNQFEIINDNTNTTIGENQISFRAALCLMRDNWQATISGNITSSAWSGIKTEISKGYFLSLTAQNKPFNYDTLIAYQIACAMWYTNDKIDYIFTADLWRQMMWSYTNEAGYSNENFQYNGITTRYDTLSGHVFELMLEDWKNQIIYNPYTETGKNDIEYIRNIFQYNRSLRYEDYFTGARANPRAVLDYNAPVVNNSVSVIDITHNILAQKLGNALNKVGNTIASQIKELRGVEMRQDYHNPFWMGHTDDVLGAPESEGTGAALFDTESRNGAKLPTVAQFRGSANTTVREMSFDRDGILMCIQYFDIPRTYVNSIDRFTFVKDKFDEFNEYFQFTGDQPIYMDELRANLEHDEYFGYTGHDMQYKTDVPKAMGGFVYDLPGWCYIADEGRDNRSITHIGPSYIRSLQTEIDGLFQSLIGYSYDTYYHFICKTDCMTSANRPMAKNPGILNG